MLEEAWEGIATRIANTPSDQLPQGEIGVIQLFHINVLNCVRGAFVLGVLIPYCYSIVFICRILLIFRLGSAVMSYRCFIGTV